MKFYIYLSRGWVNLLNIGKTINGDFRLNPDRLPLYPGSNNRVMIVPIGDEYLLIIQSWRMPTLGNIRDVCEIGFIYHNLVLYIMSVQMLASLETEKVAYISIKLSLL